MITMPTQDPSTDNDGGTDDTVSASTPPIAAETPSVDSGGDNVADGPETMRIKAELASVKGEKRRLQAENGEWMANAEWMDGRLDLLEARLAEKDADNMQLVAS